MMGGVPRRVVLSVFLLLAILAGIVAWSPWGGDDGPADLSLEVEAMGPLVAGAPASWRVTLVNAGPERELTFPTSLTADVALLGDGEEVFRASDGKVPTPRPRTLVVKPGRSDFGVSVSALDVTPGTYRIVASLDGEPAPQPAELEVEVFVRP